MPTVSAGDLVRLRDQDQYSRFYLGVLVPNTVHSSQINYVDIPRGERDIVFDTGAYSAGFTSVTNGMTVWIGTTANSHDIGKLRVKDFTGGPAAGTIQVCEHNYLLEDNWHLTVKEEFRLWPKHARADQAGLWPIRYNDYDIAYSGQNKDAQREPIVRMGPPGVAIRDGVTGDATINFWSNSGAAPGGNAPSAYAWTFRGGTPGTQATAGTAGSPHAVVWDEPGNYLATLTLDGTTSGYRPVYIFDPTGTYAPYTDFEVQSLNGDWDTGGWRASFRVKEDCAEADFPEETQVVVFAEDWYQGTEVSIGGNYRHRENLVFVGYVVKESVRRDPETNDVLFEAHTIDGEMRNCEQFPLSVEDHPNADNNWLQIQNMNMDKVAYFIMRWQSTLLDITDVEFSGDTKLVRWFDCAQKSTYEQLDQDCYDSAILGKCLSDRMGLVYCGHNPQFITSTGFRNSIDTVMDIEAQDWRDMIQLPKPQSPSTSLVDLSAGSYAGGLADVELIFSLAHGDIMMERGRVRQVDNLIGQNQNQCNRVAGNYLANFNNPYPSVRVPITMNYRVFDIAPQEWVTMSLAAADTYRGIEWTTKRLIPRGVGFSINNAIGALSVDLQLEAETSGTAGVAGFYPEDPPDVVYEPPVTPTVPPIIPPAQEEEWEGITFVSTDAGVARNNDITTSNVWTAVNAGLTDTDVYGIRIVTQTDEMVALTPSGVFRASNIRTTCAWTQILTLAAGRALTHATAVFCYPLFYAADYAISGGEDEAPALTMSWYLDPGYVGVWMRDGNNDYWYVHTHNYGVDGWTGVNVSAALGGVWLNTATVRCSIYSTTISGRLHCIADPGTATAPNTNYYIYSTDYGHTWVDSGTQIGVGYVGTLILPYNNLSQERNSNDNFVLGTSWGAGLATNVQRSTTGFNTASPWTVMGDGTMHGCQEIRANALNPNYIMVSEDSGGGATEDVWITPDAGATWTNAWQCTDGDPVKRIARNPYDVDQWILGFGNPLNGTGWIYYTDDFLATSPPTNRTGNIATVCSGMGRVTDIRAM